MTKDYYNFEKFTVENPEVKTFYMKHERFNIWIEFKKVFGTGCVKTGFRKKEKPTGYILVGFENNKPIFEFNNSI